MKIKHQEMLSETVKTLNIFGIENKDIMICGSISLDICGLFPPYRHEAHDVDVFIRCDEKKTKEIQDFIRTVNQLSNSTTKGSEAYTWTLELKSGVIINIWFYNPDASFNTEMKLESGVWVQRPADCFSKKKSYGRVKDYRDLNNIAKMYLL